MFADLKKAAGSKTGKWLIAIAVIAAIAYYFRKDLERGWNKITNYGKDDSGTGTETATKISLDKNKVLKKGDTGNEVRQLQAELNKINSNPPIQVDGVFGADTEARLEMLLGVTTVNLVSVPDLVLANYP